MEQPEIPQGEPTARLTVNPLPTPPEPTETPPEPSQAQETPPVGPPGWQKLRAFVNGIPQAEGMSMIGMLKDAVNGFMDLTETANGAREVTPEGVFKSALDLGVGTAGVNIASSVARKGIKGTANAAKKPGAGMFFSMLPEGMAEEAADQVFKSRTRATAMKAEGLSDSEITAKTGWSQDYYGNWVFETSDAGARMTPLSAQTIGDVASGRANGAFVPLHNLMDNQELYKTMPALKDVFVWVRKETDPVQIESKTVRGAADADMSNGLPRGAIEIHVYDGAKPVEVLKTLHHEIQHMINMHENLTAAGRSRGGNPEEAGERAVYLAKWIDNYLKQDNAGKWEMYGKTGKRMFDEAAKAWEMIQNGVKSWQFYHRNPGEVEARNTADRLLLDANQRRHIPPFATETVRRQDQVDVNVSKPAIAERPVPLGKDLVMID